MFVSATYSPSLNILSIKEQRTERVVIASLLGSWVSIDELVYAHFKGKDLKKLTNPYILRVTINTLLKYSNNNLHSKPLALIWNVVQMYRNINKLFN